MNNTPDSEVKETQPRARRLSFVLLQAGIYILLSTILRIVLAVKFKPDSAAMGLPDGTLPEIAASTWARVFATGFFLDIVVASVLFLPFATWLSLGRRSSKVRTRILLAVTGMFWFLATFLLIGEYFFFEEFTSRYNTVAIDYVHYWTEVSSNAAEMYPWKTIVAASLLGAIAATWISYRFARPSVGPSCTGRLPRLAAWVLATVDLVWSATKVNHQASSERVLNEISSNGMTSGMIALYTRELDYGHFFPTLPREDAYKRARELLDSQGAEWNADPFTVQRKIPGDATKPKLNVVLLLEESLGSEFWGCIKNVSPKKSLTPKLDEIAKNEGMLFTKLFADGNRTIRGIEGVLASFPPLPGDSLVARPKAHGCETLATALGRDGYSTTFVYPGRGVFDGLERFTLSNGFSRFIESKDFPNPVFSNTWGHCNEDLYDRVITEARADHAAGRPFFITALSVSNHQPFTFPAGRISEPNDRHSRKFAVKYVDYALGRFFEMAKKEPFWKDTIFCVVADHGARVYGSQTVPILSYEIPMLLAGPAVVKAPSRVDTLGCQLDVAPTLMGLIGRPYESTFFGRDLLQPAAHRFALLNHNRSIAIYREPELVALSLGKVIERFTRVDEKTLERRDLDAATEAASRDATALFQTADELYNQRRYNIKPAAAPSK